MTRLLNLDKEQRVEADPAAAAASASLLETIHNEAEEVMYLKESLNKSAVELFTEIRSLTAQVGSNVNSTQLLVELRSMTAQLGGERCVT